MYSVTQRIAMIRQPYGGYLPVKSMKTIKLADGKVLNNKENIHASLIGLAVDYLTRFMIAKEKKETFEISLKGAALLDIILNEDKHLKDSIILLSQINGLDDISIINACKLSGFDVVIRSGAMGYKPIEYINPDTDTIANIRIMVERSLTFWKDYGPVIKDGFTFKGGYTNLISAGDGDYLTSDTLWDFKVSKNNPTSKQTLQVLIYYLMGQHSIHKEFDTITKLGLYNPRKNVIRYIPIKQIPKEVLIEVCVDVIGYKVQELIIDNVQADKSQKYTKVSTESSEGKLSDIIEYSRRKGMRAIIQMDDESHIIHIYESVTQAAKSVGVSPKTVRDAAKGKYQHAGGYCWTYADEFQK